MYQNQSTEVIVKATLGGVPVTGLLSSNFTLKYWKNGASSFTVFTTTITEIGYGNYKILIPSTLVDTLGDWLLRVEGSLFDTFELKYSVESAPTSILASPSLCIVSGNIIDIGGEASLNKAITCRIVNVPKKSGTSLVSVDRLSTVPDALGNFSFALIRGITVVIEIPSTGIRQQILVPNASSAQLIDLLPPIP